MSIQSRISLVLFFFFFLFLFLGGVVGGDQVACKTYSTLVEVGLVQASNICI